MKFSTLRFSDLRKLVTVGPFSAFYADAGESEPSYVHSPIGTTVIVEHEMLTRELSADEQKARAEEISRLLNFSEQAGYEAFKETREMLVSLENRMAKHLSDEECRALSAVHEKALNALAILDGLMAK